MKFGDPCVDWFKMGKALAKLFGKKDMRILMLGLDAAGKTSILHFTSFFYIMVFSDWLGNNMV